MSLYVKIHYGPYEAFHTLSHKPQKLRGIKDELLRLGYRVDLIPTEHINCCVFEISGYQVFRCNIRNLHFNTDFATDPVARRAVAACRAVTKKLMRAQLHFWFWTLIDDSIFKRTYTSPDHWPKHFNTTFGTCSDCITCCGIKAADEHRLNYGEIKQNMLYALSENSRSLLNHGDQGVVV